MLSRSFALCSKRFANRIVARKGHDHHGPMMPPFARSAPHTGKIPEEVELVWDDSVAPETCIDFDAPHVSTREVMMMMLGMGAFFATVITLIKNSDPPKRSPVAPRSAVIPFGGLRGEMGLAPYPSEEGDDDDE